MNVRLEDLGLWAGQDEILMALEQGGQSVCALADSVNAHPATVSKALNHLIAMGLATKAKHSQDLRIITVTLTSSGEEMTKRIRELYADVSSDFEEQIEREQMAVTSHHLEQVHLQLMEMRHRHR